MSDSGSVIEKLLTAEDVAKMTGLAEKTVVNWRSNGNGPPYIKMAVGKQSKVRYRPSDVEAWFGSLRRVEPVAAQDVDAAHAKHAE